MNVVQSKDIIVAWVIVILISCCFWGIAQAQELPEDPMLELQTGNGKEVILALDVIKAFQNEDARNSWSQVGQAWDKSNVLLKVPLSAVQAAQAVVRTIYEPLEEAGKYSVQSGYHAAGAALVTYLVGATITGDLDDHIDKVGDIFDDDDDDDYDPISETSKLNASGGGKINVSGAPKGPLSVSSDGEGSQVDLTFAQ